MSEREGADVSNVPPRQNRHLSRIATSVAVLGLIFILISISLLLSRSTWIVAIGVLVVVLGVVQIIWGAFMLQRGRSSDS